MLVAFTAVIFVLDGQILKTGGIEEIPTPRSLYCVKRYKSPQ